MYLPQVGIVVRTAGMYIAVMTSHVKDDRRR